MRIFFFLLLAANVFHVTAQEGKTRILFILDASNSMNALWGRETRITSAKELLLKSIDSIKNIPNLEIALRVYGHQSVVTPTFQDCNDTKLEVPFAPNNFNAIREKVWRVKALGTTPIARSLEAAAGDFPDNKAKNIIILITDGEEACDGDPCVIAKKLKDKSINVTPFVIGLGLDLSYLEKFSCIGEYSKAEDKEQFRYALSYIINKTVNDCTVEIDLNDIHQKPTETNVSVMMYKAGTRELKYAFIHTLNDKGNPDTLRLDPNVKYDIEVHTIPMATKQNVTIYKGQHNSIKIDAPQGFIKLSCPTATKSLFINARVATPENKTLHVQPLNATEKYIVGKYNVEILTLPRINKTITVTQSTITPITIDAPGMMSYKFHTASEGQLLVKNSQGSWDWVINLAEKEGMFQLQPGEYKIVYRKKQGKKTELDSSKEFKMLSNKSILITL